MTTIDHHEELRKFDEFIEDSRRKLSSIVSRLGWSMESLSKNVGNFVICPFDASHRVPEASMDQHLQNCQWKAEGYRKDDLPLSLPSLPPGTPSTIQFDEQLQDEIIQNAKQKNPSAKIDHCHCLFVKGIDIYISFFISFANNLLTI